MKTASLIGLTAAVAAMMAFFPSAKAQNTSPYWSIAGNSNASTTSKLGTTNAVPLRMLTNNKVRMYIHANTGNVSINNGSAADPNYKLFVKGVGYGIQGSGSTYGVVGTGGSYGVSGSGTVAGTYGYGGTYGAYNQGASHGTYSYSSSGYGSTSESYDSYGAWAKSYNSDGLDATTTNGVYGVYAYCPYYYGTYAYGGYMGLYGSGGTYGVYGYGGSYGIAGSTSSGYGAYGSSYSSTGGYFRSTDGYGVEAKSDNNYYAGVFWGAVYSSGGFVTSDRNVKKNIQDFGSAMSIINKLKPKFYEFKDEAKYASLHLPKGQHYGLLAQDLEEVLPNLVHEEKFTLRSTPDPIILQPKKDGKDVNVHQKAAPAEKKEVVDIKAVNYEELIPIMIKAMQEQHEKIEALTKQVEALSGAKTSVAGNNTAIKLSGAFLGQSIPNPAKNSTTIYYNNLAANARAQLVVYDANGKMMKQVQLSSGGNGSISLDVSALTAGRYSYSLLVDGKMVETKTMDIIR